MVSYGVIKMLEFDRKTKRKKEGNFESKPLLLYTFTYRLHRNVEFYICYTLESVGKLLKIFLFMSSFQELTGIKTGIENFLKFRIITGNLQFMSNIKSIDLPFQREEYADLGYIVRVTS